MREGVAVDDFLKPDRVVIGTSSERAQETMRRLYEPFVRQGNPIFFMDERSAESRAAGNTQKQQVVETIVRDKPKIGRNDRVTIKHVMSGENKTLKYKQAEPLIIKGEWVLVED